MRAAVLTCAGFCFGAAAVSVQFLDGAAGFLFGAGGVVCLLIAANVAD